MKRLRSAAAASALLLRAAARSILFSIHPSCDGKWW
jgi:hypothetical protein